MSSTQRAFNFFYEHAGFSYDPKTQTPEQGRAECAQELMEAETWARQSGYTFKWRQDDIDSSDCQDDVDSYPLFLCIMRDENGDVVQTLGACDFGEYCEPDTNQPYVRVVEAELAAEQKRELGE